MRRTDYHIDPDHMFSGELKFLSNMYPCTIQMNVLGHSYTFGSAEAAFQAGKCLNPNQVALFTKVENGSAAKKLGRRVNMRADWDTYRLAWMKQVLLCKFTQNPELLRQLLDTYPLPLSETNTWNDTYWGICNGVGKNHLGRLLMQIRDEYRPEEMNPEGLDVLQFEHMPKGSFPWNREEDFDV